MKQLEVRFYSLDELAEAIDRKRDSHFAGNAKADLTKWGYEWLWKNGRGVVITKAPQTAKERLAEIMNRKFGLDIQVDVFAFACFMWMLLMVDGFDAMPWTVRAEEIEYWFGVEVTEKTLRNWASRLLATDNLHKSQDRTIWRTDRHNDIVTRDSVEPNNADYIHYKSRQAELITEYMSLGLTKSRAWGEAFKQLWREFGCCYYSCARLTLNAVQEDIDEIAELAFEICGTALDE